MSTLLIWRALHLIKILAQWLYHHLSRRSTRDDANKLSAMKLCISGLGVEIRIDLLHHCVIRTSVHFTGHDTTTAHLPLVWARRESRLDLMTQSICFPQLSMTMPPCSPYSDSLLLVTALHSAFAYRHFPYAPSLRSLNSPHSPLLSSISPTTTPLLLYISQAIRIMKWPR